MEKTIALEVNGIRHSLALDPDRSLLSVLRDTLDLTGAKYGCGEGQCGACTVLVDGMAVRSCVARAGALDGRSITTIEGLSKDGALHPIQEAFIEAGAHQCGYCTPGMIVGTLAFLTKNSSPSEADIVKGLEGNICRCGTYRRIISAVERAAKVMREGKR